MLSTRHVILRRVETRPTRGHAGPAAAPAAARMTVEVDELTPRRAADLRRARDVEAVAPVIRARLVAPVGLTEAADTATASTAWGIRAVGADSSPFSGDGVTVAVLDTGIDGSHEAFAGVELVR